MHDQMVVHLPNHCMQQTGPPTFDCIWDMNSGPAADATALGHIQRSRMTRAGYYRVCLLVPLVLPLVAWAVIETAEAAIDRGWQVGAPVWIGAPVMLLALGGMLYGLPYALLVAALWRPSRKWPLSTFRRLLLWLPLGFASLAGGLVAGYHVLISHDAAWPSYAGQTAAAALCVGYGQALLIAAGAFVSTKLGWLEPTTNLRSPGAYVA